MPIHAPPRLQLSAHNRHAAQKQYWRHVANRLALAILADEREPVLHAPQHSSDPTRPTQDAPRAQVGLDIFRVRAESVQYSIASATPIVTTPLSLTVVVQGDSLMKQLQLQTLRAWPPQTSTEPMFRYHRTHQRLVARDGLSGDMVALFEGLLQSHAATILRAMNLEDA